MSPLPERESGRLPVQPPAAQADGVWKSFGRMDALADVSLSVQGGECHALVGRNGAGKSTLVGVLTGLLRRTAVPSPCTASRLRASATAQPGNSVSRASTSGRW